MAPEEYDFILDVKKRVNVPYKKYYQQAKAASESGKLKLVNEIILEPYNGKGFKLDKGQVVRYEMISGAQIIDTFYMVRSRPMDEWADTFHTSAFGPHTQWEGSHYYSNNPWCRPLVTLIRDTVDTENMKKMYGEGAAHSYVLHNGSCSSGLWEAIYGIVDAYSCHVGIAQGFFFGGRGRRGRPAAYPPSVVHALPGRGVRQVSDRPDVLPGQAEHQGGRLCGAAGA